MLHTVQSLPVVHPAFPELLKALQTSDLYLAGGIVMTQAILVVIGILFSDIALAFLDPRIRYSGGGR